MAWLPGWNRRKSKIINGSTAGAQTNYQLRLTVYKGPGADTNTTVYFGGNSRSNFGDIRFTKSDGETLLDYWIESYTYGDNAVIWVEIDSIPASPGTTSIYVYYDSIDANTTSNGDNTFSFFDDFIGTSLDTNKWTITGNGFSVSGSILTITTSTTNTVNKLLSKVYASKNNTTILLSKIKTQYFNSQSYGEQRFGASAGLDWIDAEYNHRYSDWVGKYFNQKSGAGGVHNINILGWSGGVWHTHELRRIGRSDWYVDGTNLVSISSYYPTADLLIYYDADYNTNPASMYIDWVLVRKYASPEPSFGTTGTEESEAFLYAESIPPGALIIVDAIDTGVLTPGTVTVDPGTRTVVLRLDGYDDSTSILNFTPQETEVLIAQLRTSGSPTPIGNLYIESIPSGARIYIDNVDKGVLTNSTFTGLTTGAHTYRLTKSGYQDATGPFTILENQTTTVSATLTPYPICPPSLKYEGDYVYLSAIPRDGTGPYYVEFRKIIEGITTVLQQYYSQPENVEITYNYLLSESDVRSAISGAINFSVYMEDNCPTGSQTCTQICTVNIGCYAPVCNFTVT